MREKIVKILFITLITTLVVITLLVPLEVRADSFNLNVTANKQYVEPGETVVLNLKVANIDAGELGINTLEAKIEYDNDIFEELQQSDIQALNNWSITYNNEDTDQNGKFLAVIIADGVTDDQNIGKITLKVKNGVEYTKTTITISDITSNNGQELIEEDDKQIVIEAGRKQEAPPTNNGTENNNGNQNSGVEQPENMSPDIIPQAGVIINIIIIVALIALIIFAITMYIRYRKIDK